MPEYSKPVIGSFCWVEANLEDPAAGKGFYGELFGWKGEDVATPLGTYTLLKIGNNQVGGLLELPENARKMGAPPHWLSYVAVSEIGAGTKKAESLGAKVLLPPLNLGTGDMSVLQDPAGGVLALWASKQSTGSFLYGENNSLCWNELVTTDAPAATKFYVGLFGWKTEVWPMGDFDYTVLKNGTQMVGGLMPQPRSMAGAPSVWTAYFAVADCDAMAKRAERLRAKILTPPTDIPSVGRFAVLSDPQGAAFAIIKNFPLS
jgi:predicted enzyme related to lactoylglutathione lyase